MAKVVIVIPIYKTELTLAETISVKQAYKILRVFDIVFVAPNTLNFDYSSVCEITSKWKIERFDDRYFVDVYGYSELLLSVDFYKRFIHYDYMLIYQLDAFVFSNELLEFCDLGYDYIGAPVSRKVANWRSIGARVGNGGFSLRKIQSAINVLNYKEEIISGHEVEQEILKYEDLFFAYCGVRDDVDYNVAPVDVALRFAVDAEFKGYFKNGMKKLPFGCHAWHKQFVNHWRPHIEKFEYDLTPIVEKQKTYSKYDYPGYCITKRIIRMTNNKYDFNFSDIFSEGEELCIWGIGKYGKEYVKLFKRLSINISFIIDMNSDIGDAYEGISIYNTNAPIVKKFNGVCVITSKVHEREIEQQAMSLAISRIVKYSDFQKILVKEYFRCLDKCKK